MKAGYPAHAADAAHYHAAGWWSDRTLSQTVRENAIAHPDKPAYVDYPDSTLTWNEFDCAALRLAAQLAGLGVRPGDRVAVWHGDTAAIHMLFVAVERCGAVVVGIGARAGSREATQILRVTEPRLLISDAARRSSAQATVSALTSGISALVLDGMSLDADTPSRPPAAGVGADDVFLINSTSGTTGLPKCVVHTQNRWHYFHQQAVANGALNSDDIFLPVIPAPFGFGIWTAHTTPIYLGATTVLLEKFDAQAACEAIARHRVSVLCCVSTQLMMIMADGASRENDLSSLRVVFTGGEALPLSAGRRLRRAHRRHHPAVLRLQRNRPVERDDTARLPGAQAANGRTVGAGDGGAAFRRRQRRELDRTRATGLPWAGHQPGLSRRGGPRQALHT